jgi:hypothetical protein
MIGTINIGHTTQNEEKKTKKKQKKTKKHSKLKR